MSLLRYPTFKGTPRVPIWNRLVCLKLMMTSLNTVRAEVFIIIKRNGYI
jgi:hypothetical protein